MEKNFHRGGQLVVRERSSKEGRNKCKYKTLLFVSRKNLHSLLRSRS